MKCPIDNSNLQMTDRQGVEIDYCPQCRGVWLDRGEIDKIIERTAGEPSRQSSSESYQRSEYPPQQSHGKYDKHGRRKSMFRELFDF